MKKYYHSFFILYLTLFLNSCVTETQKKHNGNLIGFKSIEIGEPEYKYNVGKYKFDFNKVQINYIDDIIIVKTIYKVNGCDKYDVRISKIKDTIKLRYEPISESSCKSLRVDELTYIIDNPKKKKWIFDKLKPVANKMYY
ncbi:hypothetical protein ACSIGC_09275 [Tenacibaculum sp. ZS6-P6]|uniref:hypothetical protein n=1 Tax=Tenacibaculum sp. ZS6-P6 TaxID=3447503 RepID=UPI003F9D7D6B